MKKLILLLLMSACSAAMAQTVKHHHYTTYYNAKLRGPDSVAWDLTPDMVGCDLSKFPRKDVFQADPKIKGCATKADYNNGGYDRGHMFSFDDAACDSVDRTECFYMSNMLCQLHSLNGGDWKTLEVQERLFAKSATLHIIAGGIGSIGKLKSGVNIPAECFKAIYMDGRWFCFIMPNKKTSTGHKWDYWQVPVSELNQKTGLKL